MPLFADNNKPQQIQKPVIDTPVTDETPVPIEPEVNTNIPDISFIIEDGSIVPLANSYTTLDFADEYCANKGYSEWLQLTDEEKKISIIRGTEFVNNFYEWRGKRQAQFQALAFPRTDIKDDDGFIVLGIPEQLKKACIEASYLIFLNNSETLFQTKDENGDVKKQKVDTLEVEYFDSKEASQFKKLTGRDYSSVYEILNYMLKGLYETEEDKIKEGSSICTKAIWGN